MRPVHPMHICTVPVIAVCQCIFYQLAGRVRQQAGSYEFCVGFWMCGVSGETCGDLEIAFASEPASTDMGWLMNKRGVRLDVQRPEGCFRGQARSYRWRWLVRAHADANTGLPGIGQACRCCVGWSEGLQIRRCSSSLIRSLRPPSVSRAWVRSISFACAAAGRSVMLRMPLLVRT
jgi:hypothetical protein